MSSAAVVTGALRVRFWVTQIFKMGRFVRIFVVSLNRKPQMETNGKQTPGWGNPPKICQKVLTVGKILYTV